MLFSKAAIINRMLELLLHNTLILPIIPRGFCHLSFICRGIARTQSPTTKNCTPEFPTFGGIADFSQARCTALASTWAARLRDHKQPASGKLIQVCQLGSYEEAAMFNTCGSLTTPTLYLWCIVNTPFTAVAPKCTWLKKLQSRTLVVQSSQLRISGDVELNPVQLGSVQSSTLLKNTSELHLMMHFWITSSWSIWHAGFSYTEMTTLARCTNDK